jgi:hypothetical protein
VKVILDIKDSKVSFVLELLSNLKFVKAKPISSYKSEILEGLSDAVEEVKLAKEGKLKLKKASELFDEV